MKRTLLFSVTLLSLITLSLGGCPTPTTADPGTGPGTSHDGGSGDAGDGTGSAGDGAGNAGDGSAGDGSSGDGAAGGGAGDGGTGDGTNGSGGGDGTGGAGPGDGTTGDGTNGDGGTGGGSSDIMLAPGMYTATFVATSTRDLFSDISDPTSGFGSGGTDPNGRLKPEVNTFNLTFSVKVGANGKIDEITVPGSSTGTPFAISVGVVGSTSPLVTASTTSGSITTNEEMFATASAEASSTTATVLLLTLDYGAQIGASPQAGPGTMTVTLTPNGANINVEMVVRYEVVWFIGGTLASPGSPLGTLGEDIVGAGVLVP